jgi:hypothetical protein
VPDRGSGEVEADVWAALTGGDMPSRTRLERTLTRNAAAVQRVGVLGLYGALAADPDERRACVVAAS